MWREPDLLWGTVSKYFLPSSGWVYEEVQWKRGSKSVVLWVFLSILLLAGIAVIASVYLYRRRCLSRFHKPETSPAAGYMHTSDSSDKCKIDATSRHRQQTSMGSKSPVSLQSNHRTADQRPSSSHHPQSRQLEGEVTKTASPVRMAPPCRPAPPPPPQQPPKVLQPPKRVPPPLPPSRTRQTAKWHLRTDTTEANECVIPYRELSRTTHVSWMESLEQMCNTRHQ